MMCLHISEYVEAILHDDLHHWHEGLFWHVVLQDVGKRGLLIAVGEQHAEFVLYQAFNELQARAAFCLWIGSMHSNSNMQQGLV